jgi:uncharacterized protein (DUF1810 family)
VRPVSSSFRLDRFEVAQDRGGTYGRALAELRAGRKQTHWMWFVFPQLAGLGRSETARRYAISSLPEAAAYLRHPVLGARLRECSAALLEGPSADAREVLGEIDALKLRSSMTLFMLAAEDPAPFRAVLARFFGGEADAETERLLGDGTG